MRSDARKRSDDLSLRRGAGVVPSPGGDAITPAVVALTDEVRDVIAAEVTAQLALYTLPANYARPLYGETHDDVARRCGPIIAGVVVGRLAAAGVVSDAAAEVWEQGYLAGELDAYNQGLRAAGYSHGPVETPNPYRNALGGA